MKKLTDFWMLGTNNPTLDLQGEPISPPQPQEVGCSQRYLPQHHRVPFGYVFNRMIAVSFRSLISAVSSFISDAILVVHFN